MTTPTPDPGALLARIAEYRKMPSGVLSPSMDSIRAGRALYQLLDDLAPALEAFAQRERELVADNAALLQLLTDIRNNARLGEHQQHWDKTMRAGEGCPVCIDQRRVAQDMRERLSDTNHPGSALLAEMESLKKRDDLRSGLNHTLASQNESLRQRAEKAERKLGETIKNQRKVSHKWGNAFAGLRAERDKLRAELAERDSLAAEWARAQAALDKLRPFVEEVWQWHRDPESPDYNECDDSLCLWCSETMAALAPEPAPTHDDYIDQVVDPIRGPAPEGEKV